MRIQLLTIISLSPFCIIHRSMVGLLLHPGSEPNGILKQQPLFMLCL